MNPLRFSVLIPARNEERFIGACLDSIRVAARSYQDQLELIVVLNRCSDKAEEIARAFGVCGRTGSLAVADGQPENGIDWVVTIAL